MQPTLCAGWLYHPHAGWALVGFLHAEPTRLTGCVCCVIRCFVPQMKACADKDLKVVEAGEKKPAMSKFKHLQHVSNHHQKARVQKHRVECTAQSK